LRRNVIPLVVSKERSEIVTIAGRERGREGDWKRREKRKEERR